MTLARSKGRIPVGHATEPGMFMVAYSSNRHRGLVLASAIAVFERPEVTAFEASWYWIDFFRRISNSLTFNQNNNLL
jgi:hypothetical protein